MVTMDETDDLCSLTSVAAQDVLLLYEFGMT